MPQVPCPSLVLLGGVSMQSGVSSARETRARERHELRSLTCVMLDEANGGIIRNLTREGIAVQAVAELRAGQQLGVCFELRHPRLQVEARGEVVWATASGTCGIRFVEISPRMGRRIDDWISRSALLPAYPQTDNSSLGGSLFEGADDAAASIAASAVASGGTANLLDMPDPAAGHRDAVSYQQYVAQLDWLSQPLSARSLSWTVNALAIVAALFLFALIFLSIAGEPPKWPFATAAGAAIVVVALYWGFFKVLGGGSLGARLARLRDSRADEDDENGDLRFR